MDSKLRKVLAIIVLVFFVLSLFLFFRHYTKQKEQAKADVTSSIARNKAIADSDEDETKTETPTPSTDNRAIVISEPEFTSLPDKIKNAEKPKDLGNEEISISLSSGDTAPKTILADVNNYTNKGLLKVRNARVIAFFDKQLYGQSLALLELDGAEDYIRGRTDYANNEVCVLYGCTDTVELSKQLKYGDKITVLSSSVNMTSENIKTANGVYGNMLVIFGTYTKK